MVINFHNGIYFLKHKVDEAKLAMKLASQHNFMVIGDQIYTKSLKVAQRLREYFSENLKLKIKYSSTRKKPWSLGLYYNQNNTLDPYQKFAVEFCLTRNNSYLGLEQGLGKTIILSVIINTLLETFHANRVILVVPPFLITNWVRELRKWQTSEWQIFEYRKSKDAHNSYSAFIDAEIIIVADSIIAKEEPQAALILNPLIGMPTTLMVTDEADRFCSLDAQRTIAHTNVGVYVPRKIRASGTPMRGKPRELYTALAADAHNTIDYMDYTEYATKFCNGRYNDYTGRFDDSGVSNKQELIKRLKDYMLIMEAKNHLDLPPLVEQLVIFDASNSRVIKQLDERYLKKYTVEQLLEMNNLGEIQAYRTVVSEEKKKLALEVMEYELPRSDDTFLILGIHLELLKHLHKNLKGFGLITGQTPDKEKYRIEDDLNAGKLRGIIGQIACMVGQNYQKCSRVKFFESSWSWRDNDQAMKRVYRRGQTKKVLVEHYVIANTIEEYVLRKSMQKGKITKSIIKENH